MGGARRRLAETDGMECSNSLRGQVVRSPADGIDDHPDRGVGRMSRPIRCERLFGALRRNDGLDDRGTVRPNDDVPAVGNRLHPLGRIS